MSSRRRSPAISTDSDSVAQRKSRRRQSKPEIVPCAECADAPPAVSPTPEAPPSAGNTSTLLTGPADYQDGALYFTAHDRLLYENRQVCVQSALQLLALKKYEITNLKLEFQNAALKYEERLRKLDDELATITKDAKVREQELRDIQQDITATYRIDLQRIAYDPVSGRISVL